MAHAVVAIDQRHRPLATLDADLRAGVEPARPQPCEIARQPEDAVPVTPQKVSLDHQICYGGRVIGRQVLRDQRFGDEAAQGVGGETAVGRGHGRSRSASAAPPRIVS